MGNPRMITGAAGRRPKRSRSVISKASILVAAFTVVAMTMVVFAGCGNGTADVRTMSDTGGKISIKETYYDAGRVKVNNTAVHKYEIKNTGTGPLELGQASVKLLEGC